jgi:predicted transcriptional regulator
MPTTHEALSDIDRPSTEHRVRKVTANLPESVVQALTEVAQKRGITMTDALRRAISIQKYLEGVYDEGGTVLVERKGQPLREVVFP